MPPQAWCRPRAPIAQGRRSDTVVAATSIRYHFNRSYNGLYVCPMIWRELDNFSSGSVCMVLASNRYDEGDYAEFMRARWKGE